MTPPILRRSLAALSGAAAGATIAFPIAAAFPDAAPLRTLVCVAAGACALLALLPTFFPERWPEWGRPRKANLVGSALVALAIVLVLRPFHPPTLEWVIVNSNENGSPLPLMPSAIEWGVSQTNVASFHASGFPRDLAQPYRHRIEADVRFLAALGPIRQKLTVTQPKGTVTDALTGAARTDVDGVTGLVQVRREHGWDTVARIELEPTDRAWHEHVLEIPRGSMTAALEWTPRGGMNSDFLFAAFDEPTLPHGTVLLVITRVGEFLLLASCALVGSWLLGAFFARVSRAAHLPPVLVVPTRGLALRLRHLVLFGVLVGAMLLVAVRVAPWCDAATTAVVIDWAGTDGSTLEVFFGEGPDDHLPAVRLDATRWAADLPPRPSYRISLEVPLAATEAGSTLGAIHLVPTLEYAAAVTIPLRDFRPAPGGQPAASRPTARFTYPKEVRLERLPLSDRVRAVWIGGVAMLGLLLTGLCLLARRATTHDVVPPSTPGPLLPLVIAGALGAAASVAWALGTPTIATPDTGSYVAKAAAIAEQGVYYTGGTAGRLVRTPGYPVFLAVVFKLFGYHLVAISVCQALFHAFAVFFVGLSLRRTVRTTALVAFIVLASAWLPPLNFARLVISESVFMSFSLIALGCFFFARATPAPRDLPWLGGFAVATAAAVWTRPIAITLLAAPAVAWLSGVVAVWKTGPSLSARLGSIVRLSLPYVFVAATVMAAILGWCYRNWLEDGFFGFAAMASLSDLQGEVHPGTLDPRVLIPAGYYPAYVRERVATGLWTSWNIYMALYAEGEAIGVGPRDITRYVEDRYDQLYRRSIATMPPAGRGARLLRSAWWNLQNREGGEYYWDFDTTFEQAAELNRRYSGTPLTSNEPLLGDVESPLRRVAAWYPEIRISLLALACVAALVMLWRGRPTLVGPFAFVLAYIVILTQLGQRELRYMIVLDVFCFLQVIVALGWRPLPAGPLRTADEVAPAAEITAPVP